MDRVRFITHEGKQILVVDFSNCNPEQVTKIASEVQEIVAAQSPKSVLILNDFTGARFSRVAFTRIKEVALFDPVVREAGSLCGR